jgi:hypothetical protein
MLTLSCTSEEKILVRAVPVTPTGHLALLDGVLSVERQSGEATVAWVDGDPLAFWLVSADTPGVTAFLVSGDADLGEGVQTIADVIQLQVEGAKASSLGLVAEAPVPK